MAPRTVMADSLVELVYLTAYQGTALDSAVDRTFASAQFAEALRASLGATDLSAKIDVRFISTELSARVYTTDADRAFALLAPVFRASVFCREACVLLRYGEPGAAERQISL